MREDDIDDLRILVEEILGERFVNRSSQRESEATYQKSNRNRQTSEGNSLLRPRRQLVVLPSFLPRQSSSSPSELRACNESSIEHDVLADSLRVDFRLERPDARSVARVDDVRWSLLVVVLDPGVGA